MIRDIEGADDAVERSLYEFTDFPFPADDHAENAGHHASHREHRPLFPEIGRHGRTVFQGENPGKIDAHEVILFCPEICGRREIVILCEVLCLSHSAQDLLLRLGVDPDTATFFFFYSGHLLHQAVDIFSLTPGVSADIDRVHVRPV